MDCGIKQDNLQKQPVNNTLFWHILLGKAFILTVEANYVFKQTLFAEYDIPWKVENRSNQIYGHYYAPRFSRESERRRIYARNWKT